jgi:Protein of unknown function (DUF1549)/Protein of unknown function (DUF1553)
MRRTARVARLAPAHPPSPLYPGSDNPIDQFIADTWRTAKLPEATTPPPIVDDVGFARRVYLDVIGALPTESEVAAFVADRAPDKRATLVDRLLARREDYAAHWTPFWEEALGSQTTRLQGGIPTRGNYREWIFQQFAANVPYDVFAASLIDPAMPRHKPRTEVDANGKRSIIGYILNDTHVDTIQSAANVAQVFMGTSMKCASCHNHFLNDEWPQKRFLAFAGLFTANDLELIRCERQTGQIVPAKFPFALPEAPATTPGTLNGRLHRAALLLTDPTNPRFARAIVNRLWRRYLGLGFVEPADDFRLDRTPSHPALLDWLTDDLERHGYDLTHTIRLILTSRTYQHRYDPAREDRFDVQHPDLPRYYRSPRLRRLTAEEFIDSVRLIANGSLDRRDRVFRRRGSTALTRALGRPASRNEISTSRPEDPAVLQALELMNGPELSYLVYDSPMVFALEQQLGGGGPRERAAVAVELYRSVYGRPPTATETTAASRFLAAALRSPIVGETPGRRDTVFEDELPADATLDGSAGASSWNWTDAIAGVPVGKRAHTQTTDPLTEASHNVTGLPSLTVAGRDRLVTWVYLDPARTPKEITVEWRAGDWEHRAYWSNSTEIGDPAERRWMGPLPKAGEWVRLEVPAGEVDLDEDTPVTGWSFVVNDGTASWSGASVERATTTAARMAIGDALWALIAAPEFTFIR